MRVKDERELGDALQTARPGDEIVLADGDYSFGGQSVPTRGAGTPDAPIVVRADRLGAARLRFATVEGFTVREPYWEFRNLDIEGVCPVEDECEHAFHVTGGGAHAVIRNNRLRNFNAAIKINPDAGRAPDDVRVSHNLIFNDGLRSGARPVTMIDVVAADRVHIASNIIADFAKAGGNRVSYGAFAKGGGSGALIENNLVLCAWRHHAGQRVGLSLGGGGTGPGLCRQGACTFEQRGGVVRGNIVANCSDAGIYLRVAPDSVLTDNRLVATRGVQRRD